MSLENNNKDGKNNKKEKRSIYQIMDKQGFYIILFLCIAIVATTALWVNNQKEDYFIGEGPEDFLEETEPEITLVDEGTEEELEGEEAQATGRIGEGRPREEEELEEGNNLAAENQGVSQEPKKKLDEDSSKKDEEEPQDSEKAEAVSSQESKATVTMAVPVVGRLGLGFADDRLVYHKTLDHWSTHKGIDIHADEGTPVKAALDGEVVEVINDSIMGITITLKHEGNIFTRYSNLSTDAMVKVGEKVKKGQTISGVGRTASTKALEGPLLHFQVMVDDKFVDPQIYLGNITK